MVKSVRRDTREWTVEVLESEFEAGLTEIRQSAANSIGGVFGPGSLLWRVDREAAVFLGAGRAILLQLAHPWVATAIAEHSRTLSDPIGRFHRTFNTVFTMVFGTVEQALAKARQLHRRHAAIRGQLPDAAGRFRAGSAYAANEVSALVWVLATLTDTALATHDLVLAPLTPPERERYLADTRRLGALFGIPDAALWPDWPAFTGYVDAMLCSDSLAVTPAARAIADALFSAGLPRPVPRWYRAVTAGMLAPRLRDAFGLAYGETERRRGARALERIRLIYPWLPSSLRYVGPYHEARARLAGQRIPPAPTRFLNRLWIGQSQMTGDERAAVR